MPELSLGRQYAVPRDNCMNCRIKIVTATAINHDGSPSAGSAIVCHGCGHIMAFNAEHRLRELTGREMRLLAGSPALLALLKSRDKHT